jgi:Tfp pilus assembly protein PilF
MAYGRTVPHFYARVAVLARVCAPALGAFGLFAAALSAPGFAQTPDSNPIRATVQAKANDGDFAYARMVFSLSEYDDVHARIANHVLVMSFKRPIDVEVEHIASQIPEYVGAARRDPDGRGVRMALAKDVQVNTTAAGDKLFVDLMPLPWNGPPPSLPQDVIEDLARRARLADKLEHKEQEAAKEKAKLDPIRVHVSKQPTFTRYIFNIPDDASVDADRQKDKLTLSFDEPLKFDLGDALVELPKVVGTIDTAVKDTSSVVSFAFTAKADVRTFRDDKSYVVDIVNGEGAAEQPSAILPSPKSGKALDMAPQPAAPPKQGALEGAGAVAVAAADKPSVTAPATIAAPEAKSATPKDAAAAPAASKDAATPAAAAKDAAPAPLAQSSAKPEIAQADVVAPASTPPAEKTPQASAKTDVPNALPQTEAQTVAPSTPAPSAPDKTEIKADMQAAAPPASAPPSSQPASASPKAAAVSAAVPALSAAREEGKVAVGMVRQGDNLKLSFPFLNTTAAAIFHRADTLWIVFDTNADIDLSALDSDSSHTIRGATLTHTADADIVRIKLDRPHLSSVGIEGPVWTVQIGDSAIDPTGALDIIHESAGMNRLSAVIPFDAPHLVHHVEDPEARDKLIIVTGYAPARGFVGGKDFVEFRALASVQGVVIEPLADDVRVELKPDRITIGRPIGLALSTSVQTLLHGSGFRAETFDSQLWGEDREASYTERQTKLLAAAADAPDGKRFAPRIDLARFYMARDMYPEAKGVLDVALGGDHPASGGVSAVVLRAVTEIMMDRPDDALKDLSDPSVGDQHDAPLWRALAYARQGKWGQARDGFKRSDSSVATLPIDLQRVTLKEEMRSAIEVGDYSSASSQLNDFKTIGVPHDLQPAMSVLMGRLAEGLGHPDDALTAYQAAADSWDRRAAAQGELRETLLRYSLGDLKREDVVSRLETLTTVWRGDDTEIEALQMLARLYTEEGRYRDSFYVMRSALASHPNSDMTRRIQQEAAKTFDALFLAGKGDTLPAIDALALFYDFRELTPIGRRGDEMIRRLADRLVSVDLLDQAADLLQYQVDNRLEGAAKAQVATRLAVVYLMNHKADRALAALRTTRTADLSDDLRNQRLLLEARAIADMGRYDLALEVIGNVDGREAIRLRSDIYWAAKRWRESAEQIELMYGERWKDWRPLNEVEQSDILRAEIGYAIGEDALGMGRFRDKYAAKMAETPDAHAFQIASAPLGAGSTEFTAVAHAAAAVDTLDSFLHDMRARYPDSNGAAPAPADPAPSASSGEPDKAAPLTGAQSPVPPARAAGHTASR